ncbi:MAG: hypothetical protein HQ592_15075 [Planctomycetes bacterium]|nr:hypothetical protein [Planctomycetota bacterium]
MVPCRLTGKPFWDIYLYQDPPLWRAYINAVEYFGIDGWIYSLDGFSLPDPNQRKTQDDGVKHETVIVSRSDERIITRGCTQRKGREREWWGNVTVYPRADSPTTLPASKIGMEPPPDEWWPVEGVKPQKKGFDLLKEALEYFDDRGVIGVWAGPPQLVGPEQGWGYSIYDYCDRYDEVKQWSVSAGERSVEHLKRVLEGPVWPDFILTGGSGMLVFMTPDIVRDLALPTLKRITEVCREAGIPSQVHCCGPERELVKMCAEETELTSINPLEVPPMGNCDLADVKRNHGHKLGLMGNLHTTDVMLRGSVKDVRRESLKAIRAAGRNGGFILSTGDQCGRDTPDENIREMINVANEFGVYPLDMAAIDREIKRLGS